MTRRITIATTMIGIDLRPASGGAEAASHPLAAPQLATA
jgi:hypothetical protein